MTNLSSLDTARMAQSDAKSAAIQTKLGSLKMSPLSPEAKAKKLREACEGFESIFIQKMWQEMRKSVHQSTLLHSRDEQFWQDMYDQELAKKMTSVGGIGLADMMFEQLSSHLTSASKSTALAAPREPAFIPTQAPLLGSELEKKGEGELRTTASSLYDGAVEPVSLSPEPAPAVPPPTSNVQADVFVPPVAPVQEPLPKAPVAQVSRRPQAQPTRAAQKNELQQAAPKIAPQAGSAVSPWLLVEELQQKAAQPVSRDPVANALASMRAQAQADRLLKPASAGNPEALAQVSYASLNQRQQSTSSGLELANAAKRQAGDQLGSRGIREPLLPQTQKAKDSTLAAYAKRDAQQNEGNVSVQPLPYSHPMNQAEMQAAPASEAFVQDAPLRDPEASPLMAPLPNQTDPRPEQGARSNTNQRRVQRTSSSRRNRREQGNDQGIRILNLDRQKGASLIAQSSEVPGRQTEQISPNSGFTIPPLTAMDLGS
ncbi:MAG: rod-binding protein [Desulfovibrionaceae bacterium]|nr:rod-binding protein [Desulfovibrionaceae bacterium]